MIIHNLEYKFYEWDDHVKYHSKVQDSEKKDKTKDSRVIIIPKLPFSFSVSPLF